jgi:hypothetical protein
MDLIEISTTVDQIKPEEPQIRPWHLPPLSGAFARLTDESTTVAAAEL